MTATSTAVRPSRSTLGGVGLVLVSACSVHSGSAVAATLFPRIGTGPVIALRLVVGAVLLLALCRPSFRGRSRADWAVIGVFGVALAGMNTVFYEAIERIPLGPAVTIEVLGPLTLSVIAARRRSAWLWAGLALAGVLLLGRGGFGRLDPLGVLFVLVAAALWASYIVLSARAGARFRGAEGLALAMAVAGVLSLPLGVAGAGPSLLDPAALALGCAVALLSSVLPYSFELFALRRLHTATFAVLMSLGPAIAACAGWLILDQALTWAEAAAIVLVIAASIGAVRSAAPNPFPDPPPRRRTRSYISLCRAGTADERRAMSDADAHLQALRTLISVSKRVHGSLDLTETLDAVADGVVEAAGFATAVVNLAEPNGDFTVVSAAGSEELRAQLLGTKGSAANWQELFRRAERWDNLYFVDHRTGVPESLYTWVPDIPIPDDPDGWHPLDCLFAPLMAPGGTWVGVLSVDMPVSGRRPGPQQREILSLFAEHAAIAILHARMHSALERSQAELHYAATHDSLTGLANRAFLRDRVNAMLQEPGREVGVLVIDLNGFKRVNDAAGHEAGDEVLRVVAARMRRNVRAGDVVARLGGDEFLVVLSGEQLTGPLRDTADRLSEVVSKPIETPYGVHFVGASIGSAMGTAGDDFGALVAAADAAMYRAKRERLIRRTAGAPESV